MTPISEAAHLAQLRCEAAENQGYAPGTPEFDIVAAAVTYVWHATPRANRRAILLVGIEDVGEVSRAA